jgi:chemotaxis protein methyltransferase CheR
MGSAAGGGADPPALSARAFGRIQALVGQHFGLRVGEDKRDVVAARLSARVRNGGHGTCDAFVEAVEADASGRLLDDLGSLMATSHTWFFREPAQFDRLARHVLPEIERRHRGQPLDLRVWCAAAATGEEAYSIAIVLREHFGARYGAIRGGVLATDLSRDALRTAAQGRYSAEQLQAVPEERRRRHFRPLADGGAEVRPEVRSDVVFRRLNLASGRFAFRAPFHVIFCRNVMMYFDEASRRRLVDALWEWTAPGGYLFVGHADGLERRPRRYEPVCPAVYRRPESPGGSGP